MTSHVASLRYSPDDTSSRSSRWSRWIRIAAYVAIAINIVLLVRLLPFDNLIHLLTSRVQGLGVWAPVVFGVVYVVAALLFIPGAALTIAAGAVFGLLGGTIVVSIASTIAAALGFLIGRHFAREAVVRRAATSPRFAAMERAIQQGGWKIIGLLRLSPALPFSLGNYLYGLTPIRFVPYVITSWLAMLPGTIMYVYLGHAGRQSLAAASGDAAGRSVGQWVLLVIGLLATIAVTIYVTYLAKKALAESSDGANESNVDPIDPTEETSPMPSPVSNTPKPQRPWRKTLVPMCIALVLTGASITACANESSLAYLFGPPKAKLEERFLEKSDGPTVDHTRFHGLLKKYVDDAGYVDYTALSGASAQLDAYVQTLATAPIDSLGRSERLALLINAYNAFTLRLILDNPGVRSIKDIPTSQRWDHVRWNLAGTRYSLNQIEHELIRPNFKEPRIHFALVCAAVGCPPLRAEAYVGHRLEEQLAAQTRYVHTHPRWFRYEPAGATVHLTKLYDWYGSDFEQVSGSAVAYAAENSAALAAALKSGRTPSVRFLEYDWSLNTQASRK